jgi:hypothetical protein
MRIAPRSALATAIAILTATAACGGDSTGPGPTTTNLAVHFDSLYVAAKALSATDTSYNFRTIALSDLELPAAFGATPTTIVMTTAAGTESWKGFVFEEVLTNNGTPADSGRLFLAYRDADAHTLIVTVLRANGSFQGASLISNDTVIVQASSNTGSITQTAVGASCPAPPAGLTNPVITTAAQATCLLATYSATLTFDFPATTGVDPALAHLSFPTTTFAGERFQDPFGASISRVSSVWQHASLRRD